MKLWQTSPNMKFLTRELLFPPSPSFLHIVFFSFQKRSEVHVLLVTKFVTITVFCREAKNFNLIFWFKVKDVALVAVEWSNTS